MDKSDVLNKLVGEIEVHNVSKIREYFTMGIDPNDEYKGRRLIDVMITMYMRSPRFSDCIKAFSDFGLIIDDKFIFALFQNNAHDLKIQLDKDPTLVSKRFSLIGGAYIPLIDVSMMHLCAEYNLVDCAQVLLHYGADINAEAGLDENGFGGQTPIFHTVNQNLNNSIDMFYFLLYNGADLDITIRGIEWGKGYDWETMIPSVNPLSYAMMGLLPQMHRREKDISEIINVLMKEKYGLVYTNQNIPNKYLKTF